MLAFWVAFAVMCTAVVAGMLAYLPWRDTKPSVTELVIGAACVFGAVYARGLAYGINSHLFENAQDLYYVQAVTGIGALATVVASWFVCIFAAAATGNKD